MNAHHSICLIMPYFGQWPFWLPFFLQSCKHNPDINWLFYTDCPRPENLPDNVEIHQTSFSSYCELVSKKLDIDFTPKSAYKLCDIRPALGFIHEEDIRSYDFWGWGDIDVVYGDLRAYFTQERLLSGDLFSTHARRVSGHLCLIRNTNLMREAFLNIKNWQSKFANPEHLAVDEKAFSRLFLRHKNLPGFLRRFLGFFNPWFRRSEFTEAFSTPLAKINWIDGSRNFPHHWIWHNGKLTNDIDGERNFPYFHFIVWKKQAWKNVATHDDAYISQLTSESSWIIDANGFRRPNQ